MADVLRDHIKRLGTLSPVTSGRIIDRGLPGPGLD
jgi:hypothetical protein